MGLSDYIRGEDPLLQCELKLDVVSYVLSTSSHWANKDIAKWQANFFHFGI